MQQTVAVQGNRKGGPIAYRYMQRSDPLTSRRQDANKIDKGKTRILLDE